MENKWWEYYAVRYFVGTVFGAAAVVFLNTEPGSPFKNSLAILGDLKEVTFLGVGLVAALGFAFCYLASAPVLTLHATRAHWRLSVIKGSPCKVGLALLPPIVVAILTLLYFLPPIVATISGLVMGIQGGLVALAAFTKFSVVEKFYRELATVRANALPGKDNPATPGLEYVTSYRHMREHGNAYFIVLLEGLLAFMLLHSPSRGFAIVILTFWLLPAAAAWLVGTVLESRLVSKSLP